jgi:hypothetical protein
MISVLSLIISCVCLIIVLRPRSETIEQTEQRLSAGKRKPLVRSDDEASHLEARERVRAADAERMEAGPPR